MTKIMTEVINYDEDMRFYGTGTSVQIAATNILNDLEHCMSGFLFCFVSGLPVA
jgi:hypothetical protein